MSTSHVFAMIALIAGCVLELLAVLGLAVMRDVFDRLHYVGMAGYGGLLIGISVLIRESFSLIGDKSLATGVVLVAVGPVLAHTTARSFRTRERGDWRKGIEGERE